VFVKVSAQNIRGTSAFSAAYNGAIILTKPAAPVIQVVSAQTAGEQITLNWQYVVWPYDGGTPVISYTVFVSTTNLANSFSLK